MTHDNGAYVNPPRVWDITISAQREVWHSFDQEVVEAKIREALIGWGFTEVRVNAR